MDRMDCMRAFVATADLGGFSRAAAKLGVARALVSKRVAALEAEMGTRLFARTTRRLSLTEPGRRFHVQCANILGLYASAEAELRQLQDEPTGLLKVNAPMSFGTLHLADAVAEFMALHPALNVQLVLDDRFVDLLSEGFDVGIRIGALADSSLIVRRLCPSRRVLCAAPGYLDAAGIPAHPRDLANHRCLHYGYLASGLRWRLSGPDGEHTLEVPLSLCANNGEALLRAAIAGRGIVLLPTFICGADLRAGRLVRVLPDYAPPPADINAIWPGGGPLPSKVRRFVDFLVERFGDAPAWDAPS